LFQIFIVMPAKAGIHVFRYVPGKARRGWPGHARPWRWR